MKSRKVKISLLLIYAIFLNPISIGGLEPICYALVYGIPMAYIFARSAYIIQTYFKKLPLDKFLVISWIFIALLMSFIVPSLHETNDYSYVNVILAIFRKTIILVFLFLITERRHEKVDLVEMFMLYYSIASILYIFSTVIFTMIPSFRVAWQDLLHLSSSTLMMLSSYGYTNRFGWAGFAGFRNTIDCTLSLIFFIYLYASKDSKLKITTWQFVTCAFICFLGNMFYGRSGVIASAICLLLGLFLYKKIKPKVILNASVVIAIGVLIINTLRSRIPAVDEWYNWISIPFINFLTTGSFNNYSAYRLLNEMIFFPGNSTLFFGDGRYTEMTTGLYYMRTDSGFMRQVLFWGIGPTFFMYLAWLCSLFSIKRDKKVKLLLLIMCVLFEIKGEVYYDLLPLFLIIGTIDYKISTTAISEQDLRNQCI